MEKNDKPDERQKIAAMEERGNPLYEVEVEIRSLMKKCSSLSHDLDETKKKCHSETKKMLLDVVGVMDAFENVFRSVKPKIDTADKQTKIWIDNFETVYELLQRALETAGITPVEAIVGMKVNPHWHNVFEVVEKPCTEHGIIVEEIKKGYLWKGKLLRPSEVKAVKNPS